MFENISLDCEIQNHTEMDYDFSTLPPHVLAYILSQLDMEDFKNASNTCKAWYYASCDPRISEQIYLCFTSEPTDSLDIFERPVTKLRFDNINFDKFGYKKLLRNFGHKITELYISSCSHLRITQLFEMFIYLSNLKVLRLEYGTRYFKPNNFYKHRRITKHKARIMRNLGRVQELHISTVEKNLKGAEIILNYCTNLKTLKWNENVSNENPDYFLHNVLINRNNNCMSERLESLTVHTIDQKQNSKFFEHLINLNRMNLRSLDLKEINDTYYDVMFKEFCKTYKSLERLTMYGCNEQHLADICKYMRNLKSLNLDNVTATNFSHVGYLNNLENFILRRVNGTAADQLIELFRLKPQNLTDLTLANVSSVMLKELCENLPQLKRLRLEFIETKECEPIFRHLTRIEQLHLEFVEFSKINSKLIESDLEWNVTRLVELEDLYVSTFLPGFTPDLISKLPKLKTNYHEHIYDIPEPEVLDETNGEENINENDENNEENENGEENEELEEEHGDDANDGEEPIEEEPEVEENREYDLMEFDVFSMWLCDTDTVICQPPSSFLDTYCRNYFYTIGSLTIQLCRVFKLASGILDTLNWLRKITFIRFSQDADDEIENNEVEEVHGHNDDGANELGEEKNRAYDLIEFHFFSAWLCDDIDTTVTVIREPSSNSSNVFYLSYFYKFILPNMLRRISGIVDTLNWCRRKTLDFVINFKKRKI